MRFNSVAPLLLAVAALVIFASMGCDESKKGGSTASGGGAAQDPHAGHNHDEHGDEVDDHPAHGPFGGHVFKLDTAEFQGEWKKYKDNDVIKMYILDAAGKKAAPIKVDSFTVIPKVGDDETSFVLEPEEPDADGVTAVYTLDDKDLSIAIPLGVDIEIKVGEKVFKGEIKAHAPLDH